MTQDDRGRQQGGAPGEPEGGPARPVVADVAAQPPVDERPAPGPHTDEVPLWPSEAERDAQQRTGQRSGRHGRRQKSKKGSFLRELPVLILVALGLALLIKTFVVQAFFIPSASMEKTLHGCPGCNNDRVLVNKLVYDFRSVHRGEIVVFDGKGTGFPREVTVAPASNIVTKGLRGLAQAIGVGPPSESDFIKRVIGVPGDHVVCCDTQGRVTVNGAALQEPYVFPGDPPSEQPFAKVVGPGQLFVMGDHRSDSSDSRANGTIPEDQVIGRAFMRVWPLTRIGLLHVPSTFDQKALSFSGSAFSGPSLSGPSSSGTSDQTDVAGLVALPVLALLRRRGSNQPPSR